MKYYKVIFLAALFVHVISFSQKTNNSDASKEYIWVDVKTKEYHKDGSRSYKDYKPFKTRTIELLPNFTPNKKVNLSKYGGNANQPKQEATGFYHVQKIKDRWWGIDPEGSPYFNIGLNSINVGRSPGIKKALKEKFGTKEQWISKTVTLLQENGFNCAGSWSDVEAIVELNKTLEKPMAYTINWNFMSKYGYKRGGSHQVAGHTGYPNDAIFVFDPEFKTFCDEHAKKLLEYKDDPNLFGHFSDNEMPFKYNALENYLKLPKDDYGYKAAKKWLKAQGISKKQITSKHKQLFRAYVAETYFSTVSAAIKKHDPNHMYIGTRFYSKEKNNPLFMEVVGTYVDAISINYYNHWTPNKKDVANWTAWSNRPFIITEYYTKGEDSGMGNTTGAGWIVRTQKDRGLFYQNYNLALLASKNCVGWHYFRYQDNDPRAKATDPSNLDANKGVVDVNYNVWTPMMEKMKELNTQVYPLIKYFDSEK